MEKRMMTQIYRLIFFQIKRIFVIYREIAFFRERAAARERERQREEEERANRRAKAEKERKRSHGRERKNRERRWQHREETMATNREREAERDLVSASQNNSVKPELTLNLASKRRAALMALAEDEEFDDEEVIMMTMKTKPKKGKRKLVKELVVTISTDKGGLWNWNVKWEELDENILNKKL
ncbi:hypothetical protein RhiirA1_403271 [Rhizophagus irregularis]|uniref:Uncharacterized protein n=1 Tax=Rhizophagus irregularis TaxID=588596 RepID=A0A2N0QV31_9GLOM|nr:hypothetical protein RhiirA1_403271 [Rhizophagus irregularis]